MKYLLRKISGSVLIVMLLCGSFIIPYISIPEYVLAAEEQEYVGVNNETDALAGVIAYLNYRGLGFLSDNINAVRALLSDSQVELSEFYDLMKKTPAGILRFTYNAQCLLLLNKIAQKYIDKYGILNYDANITSPIVHNVYSGELFTDDEGNNCLVYVLSGLNNYNSPGNWMYYNINDSDVNAVGTWLKYSDDLFSNNVNQVNYLINNKSISSSVYKYTTYFGNVKDINVTSLVSSGSYGDYVAFGSNNSNYFDGKISIIKNNSNGEYYLGSICFNTVPNFSYRNTWSIRILDKLNITGDPADITVKTPKGVKPAPDPDKPVTPKTRDGSYYQYNYSNTYIDNSIENNTTYYGGDDGGDDGGEENPPESGCDHTGIESRLDEIKHKIDRIISLISTPSDWTIPDPSDIDLHDTNFGLPVQLEHYFPFCIPWDMILLFEALDAEPEPPRFQGPIHFELGGITLYTWNVDIDFTPYSDVAERVRNVEFVGFLLFLMLLTAKLFRG